MLKDINYRFLDDILIFWTNLSSMQSDSTLNLKEITIILYFTELIMHHLKESKLHFSSQPKISEIKKRRKCLKYFKQFRSRFRELKLFAIFYLIVVVLNILNIDLHELVDLNSIRNGSKN